MKKQTKVNKPVKKSFKILGKVMTDEKNSNKIIGLGIIFLVVVFAFLLFRTLLTTKKNKLVNETIPNAVKKILNDSSIKVGIDKVKEVSGVYEFELSIGTGADAKKYVSYITKDANIIFTSGIKLNTLKETAEVSPAKKKTCNDLQKVDDSNLTAFVVADCPFGLQMQRVFKMAVNQSADLNSFLKIRYLGSIDDGKISSMHGDEEAQENLRQICLREEQPDYYWPYLSCYMQAQGKSADCLVETGVNEDELTNCTADSNRGLKYAKADFDLANKFNVGSSPTLLLNDKEIVSEFDFGGRTPNSIKDIACCGQKEQSSFCGQELSKNEVAASFSASDETDTAGASNANCGQ